MLDFEFLVRGCYTPEQLIVDYNPTHLVSLSPEMRATMEQLWQNKLAQAQQKHFPLFDGQLFRFMYAEERENSTLRIKLGNTSYKEYVATRSPEFSQQLTRDELSNPLSVCSVIETLDGYVLLEKREGTDVHEGRIHVIGGFMERGKDTIGHAPSPFAAMNREMREETGIRESDIREQYCLGVVYDVLVPHPELCFVTRLNIPLTMLARRKPEDNEVKELQMLRVNATTLKASIQANHGNISPTGEAALILYGTWKFGAGWFEDVMVGILMQPDTRL
jgi:8-oxo-dGTP pyrophosphatase MutT (NUDIX family)